MSLSPLAIVELIVDGLEKLLQLLLKLDPKLANNPVILDLIKVLEALKALEI